MATAAPASVKGLDYHPRGEVFPSPRDWRDQFMYQLLIDRFDDNQEHPAYSPKSVSRGRDKAQGGVFQGGTLKGITCRLDYIRSLGCTTVWISPPFKQRLDDAGSYPGYAIQDFLDIDPRYGTVEDLQALSREAHRRGMYVVLDIVVNHTADVFRYTEQDTPFRPDGHRYVFKEWHKVSKNGQLTRDDAVWPIELQYPDAFKRRGSIQSFDSQEQILSADFFSLKDLDTTRPDVMNTLIDVYKYWIAVADVDGYRIDTAKHVESDAMARFCNAIHEYCMRIGKYNFLMFGEVVGEDSLLNNYVGSNGPAQGTQEWYPRFDAVLDFPLYSILDEAIKGENTCGALRARYDRFRKYWRDQGEAAKYYITFIDNHDQSHRPGRRFLHGAGDPRLAVVGIGYLLCNLGIPCIYYGTEQAFGGGGDSDAYIRETMFGGKWGAFDTTGVHFFDPTHPAYDGIAKIAAVRRNEMALRYGRQYFRDISGDGEHFGCPTTGRCTLGFSRIFDIQELLVTLNLDDKPRQDWVQVDGILTSPGSKLLNLLAPDEPLLEVKETAAGAAVQVPMDGRTIGIYKKVG